MICSVILVVLIDFYGMLQQMRKLFLGLAPILSCTLSITVPCFVAINPDSVFHVAVPSLALNWGHLSLFYLPRVDVCSAFLLLYIPL